MTNDNVRKFKMHKGLKASIAFFIASLVSKGIAYITTPIYIRLLTSEEYGQVSLFLTWFQVFAIVATFCLERGVFNTGMVEYPEKRDEYSLSMLILSNVITLCFSVVLIFSYPLISFILKIDLPLIVLMCVLFFFQPAYNFWVCRQRYEFKYKALILWSIILAVLSPTISIICILNADEGARLYPRILGAEITFILVYIGFYIYLGIKNKWKIETKYWKTAFFFNLPLIPHYLSTYLLGSSDKIMISHIVSDSATAYYSVAYSVAAIAGIVWTAVNGSLIPFTYEKCKVRDFKSIDKVTKPILTVFAVCCVGVIMLAPEVVKIMARSDYMEAIYVIPPIVGGVFFQVQYFIYANILYYYKKPKLVMIGSVTAVVLNIILNYIFISIYGYIAAGYTTIVCYLIQAIIDYFAMRKVENEKIYDMRFIVLLSAGIIFVSLISNLTYNTPVIRYVLVAIIIIVGIVMRKRIFNIIKFSSK